MAVRSGTVTIEWEGRRIEGQYILFGQMLTLQSSAEIKTARLGGLHPDVLARMMLRALAQDGKV